MNRELYSVIQDVAKTNKFLAEAVTSMYTAIFESSPAVDIVEQKLGTNPIKSDEDGIYDNTEKANIDVDDPKSKAEEDAEQIVDSLPADAFGEFAPPVQEDDFQLPEHPEQQDNIFADDTSADEQVTADNPEQPADDDEQPSGAMSDDDVDELADLFGG